MAMSNAHRKLMDVALNGNEHDMRKLLSHESFLVNVNRMMMPDHEVPLHKAMCNADLGVAKALLEYDADVNYSDRIFGRTPLHIASCKDERSDFVELLLQQRLIDVNATTNVHELTPLHMAARFTCPKVVELLLNDRRVAIDAKTVDGLTALHLVAEGREDLDSNPQIIRSQEDRCNVVRMLLEAEKQRRSSNVDCHLNQSDVLKRFPIHYGVECDSEEVVKELLKWTDTAINARDIYGLTPLHLATRSKASNREAIVALLLDVHNIDINIKSVMSSPNEESKFWMAEELNVGSNVFLPFLPVQPLEQDGSTPLHLAADEGHVEVVDLLLHHDAKPSLAEKNGDGNTPLHLAADEGHVGVVEVLLQHGAESSPFEKNGDGNTPLHLAADEGHVEVVNLLLNHSAKPRLAEKNGDGNTPLHLASKEGHEEVVGAILLSEYVNKSILNAINGDGNTPLHLATKNGHANVVTKMLEDAPFKFDLNAKNKNGHTPLHFATRQCHLHIVKALCLTGQQLLANLEDGSGKTCLQYAMDQQDDNIKLGEITNILMGRSDVKDFFDRQYRDRQVFIDAANALLVGGALIAGITFASWLTPPLGYITYYQFHQSSPGTPANTFEAFAGLEMHYSLRIFWVFNTLSFFFAIATIISGAKAAFPDLDTVFIVESLRSVRRELYWTSILLQCAIVTVLGSFVCAGFAILPPIQRDVRNMKFSVVIGLVICSWTIFKFLMKMKLLRTMAKVIKENKATSRKQQTKDENLWVWLLQSVKFMHRPREDEDDEMEEEAATRLNTKMGSDLLVKTSNKSLQCLEYVGEGVNDYDVGAMQGNGPARQPRRRYYYFEITIKDCGRNGRIGIGFTDEDFKNCRQPGWEPNSYGYHGDDGNLFHEPLRPDIGFGPTFSTNDIVGAGIDHLKQKIFFTKNGELVGRYIPNEVRDTLYPTIGLHSQGEKVEVNFGQQKFAYNLDLNEKL